MIPQNKRYQCYKRYPPTREGNIGNVGNILPGV
jgi:hypothetical protein